MKNIRPNVHIFFHDLINPTKNFIKDYVDLTTRIHVSEITFWKINKPFHYDILIPVRQFIKYRLLNKI